MLYMWSSYPLLAGPSDGFPVQPFNIKFWDLLERVQEQLVAGETGTVQPTAIEVNVVRSVSGTERGSTSPDPEMHCQQMFLNAVS